MHTGFHSGSGGCRRVCAGCITVRWEACLAFFARTYFIFRRRAGGRDSTFITYAIFGIGGGAFLERRWVLYTTDVSFED
jgi:hypothetical protein